MLKEGLCFLDILVNSTNINRFSKDHHPSFRENYRAVVETNIRGVALVNETFSPLLRASKYPQRRNVIETSGLDRLRYLEGSPYQKRKFVVVRLKKACFTKLRSFSWYGWSGRIKKNYS